MKKLYGQVYTFPLLIWLTLFVTIPMIIILFISFMTYKANGGYLFQFTLDAYKGLLHEYYLIISIRTLAISLGAALIVVLLAMPTAYFMARSRYKDLFLLLIIIPFWTNFLIRIYAWKYILGSSGILNKLLIGTGLIDSSIQFLNNPWAVLLVTVYTYLPFGILPLYSTIEKFDFSLLEAAMDLGANRFRAIWSVLIPNIIPGIATSIIFTLIPAIGNFAIAQIIGDKNSLLLGNVIANELVKNRNYPLSSAISIIFTLVTMAAIVLFMIVNRMKPNDAKKVKEDV